MNEDSTVFEALQLLQNKSIDDVILETVLLHDSSQGCLVISLPNVKINTFKEYLVYKSICKEIFKFSNRFSETSDRKKNSLIINKNLKGEYVTTMRFVTVNHTDFERMRHLLTSHIKKLFFR